MAIPAVNLTYIGQPSPAAAYQIVNNGLGGPLSKTLLGVAQCTLDGASTTFTLGWIDGVQKIFQGNLVVLALASVTAPATINGVANQAVYSGVGAYGQFRVGQSVTFAGFTNGGNNGAFTITALTSSSIQVTNASSVAETNYASTVTGNTVNPSTLPIVQLGRAFVSAAGVADTGLTTITAFPSAVTSVGCTVNLSAAGTNAQTLSVYAELFAIA